MNAIRHSTVHPLPHGAETLGRWLAIIAAGLLAAALLLFPQTTTAAMLLA